MAITFRILVALGGILLSTWVLAGVSTSVADVEYLIELPSEHPWNPADALQSKDWKPMPSTGLNFGYSRSSYWVRFPVSAASQGSGDKVLELGIPTLDELNVFIMTRDGRDLFRFSLGDHQPFPLRPILSTNFAVPLQLQPGDEKLIVLKVRSSGTIGLPLKIWSASDFHENQIVTEGTMALYMGAMLMMVVYNLFVFFSTRMAAYAYYCGYILCACLGLMTLRGQSFHYLWPQLPLVTDIVMTTSCFVSVFFSLLFVQTLLRISVTAPRVQRPLRVILFSQLGFVALCFVLPYSTMIRLGLMTLGILAVCCVLLGGMLFRKVREARYFLAGWSCLGGGILIQIFDLWGLIPHSYWTENSGMIGMLGEAVLLSFALADQLNQYKKRLAESNVQLHSINDNLESLVADQTLEIRSLLDHIPQGVFSIDKDLRIARQYSAHLPKILGTEDIAGRSVMELLIDPSALSRDEKDRILQSLSAVLEEDLINFEINVEQLPAELAFRNPYGAVKTFALTWNVDTNTTGVVKRILVTILDVTQARTLEQEIARQESRMLLVRELIDCGAERFHQFVKTVQPLLDDSKTLLELGAADQDWLRLVFMNAHTAKGAARTLGLSALSAILHEAEQSFAEALHGNGSKDLSQFQQEMGRVLEVFNQYNLIHTDILGHKKDLYGVWMNREFLVQHCRILKHTVASKFHIDRDVQNELQESYDHIIHLIYSRLPSLLDECFKPVADIARVLGKPAPHLTVEAADIPITQNVEDVLRRISIHLIRNAIDHGIETSEEREKVGKASVGRLWVKAAIRESTLNFVIYDDGRGLALGKLKKNGLKLGLLSEQATPLQIAATIFDSGTSTAGKVSHISGRGIGMPAVKRFVEEAGGTITIQLGPTRDECAEYLPFEIHIQFPLAEIVLQVAS